MRRFLRNAVALLGVAGVLLAVFELSGHRLPVLPQDASPAGVIPGALLIAVALTVIEAKLRPRRRP